MLAHVASTACAAVLQLVRHPILGVHTCSCSAAATIAGALLRDLGG